MAKASQSNGSRNGAAVREEGQAAALPWQRIVLPIVAVALAVVAAFVLNRPEQAAGLTYEVKGDSLVIETSTMNDRVEFLTYHGQTGDTNLMVVNNDGELLCRLDTCYSCSGSPQAYYTYSDGAVICQNCGFDFAIDNLDERRAGCSPQHIDYSVDGSKISIATRDLEAVTGLFSNISRPNQKAR